MPSVRFVERQVWGHQQQRAFHADVLFAKRVFKVFTSNPYAKMQLANIKGGDFLPKEAWKHPDVVAATAAVAGLFFSGGAATAIFALSEAAGGLAGYRAYTKGHYLQGFLDVLPVGFGRYAKVAEGASALERETDIALRSQETTLERQIQDYPGPLTTTALKQKLIQTMADRTAARIAGHNHRQAAQLSHLLEAYLSTELALDEAQKRR